MTPLRTPDGRRGGEQAEEPGGSKFVGYPFPHVIYMGTAQART